MRNQLIYDLPTRVMHWAMAVLFVIAFVIANTLDDEAPSFSYHMLAGLLLVFTVVLRILWGFLGTSHARFTSFALRPKDLVAYFSGILSGDKRKWAGHNPASSWAAIAMFGLAFGLGLTGYLMATGGNESLKDIHELLANGFLAVVLMHIAGLVLHNLRHGDKMALAMVDGNKENVPPKETISNSRPWVALLFVALIAAFAAQLVSHYDSQMRTLTLFGATLQLGENESENENNREHEKGGERENNSSKSEQGEAHEKRKANEQDD